MKEVRYAKEAVDYKLVWLRFRKKIWILPVAMVLGALIVLGLHYFSRVFENGGRTYETTSVFYLDFANDESGKPYEFINYYTWGELIHSDYFIDNLYDSLGGKYTKDKLIKSVSATIESDVRYLYVRVTTNSSEESLEIAGKLEPVVIGFAGEQKEFNDIKLSDRGDTFRDSTKLRIKNAVGLGAVLGLLTCLFVLSVYVVLDTSIYIPATVERRYHIPALGTSFMSEYEVNLNHFLGSAKNIAYIPVDTDEQFEFKSRGDHDSTVEYSGMERRVTVIKDILSSTEAVSSLKTCDAVVLGVKAGCHNDKLIERYLDELGRLDVTVTAILLCEADRKLIDKYYS